MSSPFRSQAQSSRQGRRSLKTFAVVRSPHPLTGSCLCWCVVLVSGLCQCVLLTWSNGQDGVEEDPMEYQYKQAQALVGRARIENL